MSKYDSLWRYLRERGAAQLTLTFGQDWGNCGDAPGSFLFEIQKGVTGIRIRSGQNFHEGADGTVS